MRKSLVLIVLSCVLVFISCGGEAIFAGRAHRLKAEKGLKEIRNALEKYMIKNGQYPLEVEWERVLEPYFRKEINPDPEWITRRKMSVMRAKTKITQCEGIVKELKKDLFTADSSLQIKISEYLYPIDSALTFAAYEIKEAREYDYRNIEPELNSLLRYISGINIEKEKDRVISLMVQENEELAYMISGIQNSLLIRDSLRRSDLIEEDVVRFLFGHIEKKLENPLLAVQSKDIPESVDETDTIPLYSESIHEQVKKIINVLDSKKDVILINDLKEFDDKMVSYVNGGRKIDFLGDIVTFKKKIPLAVNLFNSFYSERFDVLNNNRVLNGYSSLLNLVSMVKLYEDEKDIIPQGNLYELFKEEEAMKEIKNDLLSDPYLEISANGYRLTSEAQDENRTQLVMEVNFINNYKELVEESFSEGPYYKTDDAGMTYFIWVKAKDVEETILAARPKSKGKGDR